MAAHLVFLCLFLSGARVFAQPQTPTPGLGLKKPVSVSYENLTRCFPELEDEKLSFKVDLDLLKDVIDKKFVTLETILRQRKVNYLDSEQQEMNLILRTKMPVGKKKETELILQQVDAKGIITDMKLTNNQRWNPQQELINNFLLNAKIKSDEFLHNDTKLNGVTSTYLKNFKEVQEIELTDKVQNRSVSCEKKSDLGIICTCTKK